MAGRAAGVAATAALLAGGVAAWGALDRAPDQENQAPGPDILTLEAAPRVIDEGDFVQLLAQTRDSEGGGIEYTWDFGDDTAPQSGEDLATVSHRYLQDRAGYPVRVRATDARGGVSQRTIRVLVENVAPRVQVIERDGPALLGEPLGLRATATDPGPLDELTFDWDFGDGDTAQGQSVRHVFREAGRHTVTVTVRDGDGGEDQATLDVVVGLGHQFVVQGEVAGFLEGSLEIAGVPIPDGLCMVRLRFIPRQAGVQFPGLAMTWVVPGGLRVREYPFGSFDEPRSNAEARLAPPSIVVATLQTERVSPTEIANSFRSHGGVLSIDYMDGRFIEGTFQARMEEIPPYDHGRQRHANVQGHFAARLPDDPLTGYRCRPPDTFEIAGKSPVPNEINVDWQNPELAVAFTEPVDVSSVSGNIVVNYRLADPYGPVRDPAFRAVEGSWRRDPADDRRIVFTPQASLIDGVIYCIRLRTGERGVRGADREVLPEGTPVLDARTRPACAGGSPWTDAVEWAFYTVPELSNVRASVYQVHRNVMLVPEKTTLTRVLWDWHPKQGIHLLAQVDSIPGDVRVEANGRSAYPPKLRRPILRSDRFDEQDSVRADDGVKFYGWRPPFGPPVSIRTIIEPSGQRGTPRRFEGGTSEPIERWRRAPALTIDWYIVRAAEWADGVDTTTFKLIRDASIDRGAAFATQNLPVTATNHRYRGQVVIPERTFTNHQFRGFEPGTGADVAGFARFISPADAVAWELWTLATPTDADVIVGVIPSGIDPGFAGRLVYFTDSGWDLSRVQGGRRVILLRPAPVFSETTLAHELGHWFGLCHTNDPPGEGRLCVEGPWTWQGFKLDVDQPRGWNKDGWNQEAEDEYTRVEVMWTSAYGGSRSMSPAYRFMTREHYLELMRRMDRLNFSAAPPARAPPRLASLAPKLPRLQVEGERRLVVEGIVNPETGAAAIRTVRSVPGDGAGSPPAAGPFALRSYDAAGRDLGAVSFAGEEALTYEDPDRRSPLRHFAIALPDMSVARVAIERGGSTLLEYRRSPNAPVIAFVEPAEGARITDGARVRWRATDADGDSLDVRVRYSPDGQTWQVLAWDLRAEEFRIEAGALSPGPASRLELSASDGFNETLATRAIRLEPGLRIEALSPGPGAVAAVDDIVEVMFLEDLDAATIAPEPLVLLASDGAEVPADAHHVPGSRRITLLPVVPLAAGMTYTATLRSGVADRFGNRLAQDLRWSFTAQGTTSEPRAVTAQQGVSDSSAGAGATPASPAPDPAGSGPGAGGARVSVRAGGRPDLSFEGSGVDGAAGVRFVCYGSESPAFLSLHTGRDARRAERALVVTTASGIAPGATGSFELDDVLYTLAGGALSSRPGGTLTITRHEAAPDPAGRRIAGRLAVTLIDPRTDRDIPIEAEFDVNAACAPFGR